MMRFTFDPSLPGLSAFQMAWQHAKTALWVGFVLSILAVLFLGEVHFRLVARFICPGAQLIYAEYSDSEGETVISAHCQSPGESPREQTPVLLLAIFILYTLGAFTTLLAAGVGTRLIRYLQKWDS